jgi:hypothetical protein
LVVDVLSISGVAIPSLFWKPSYPPSLWNVFRQKRSSKETETRAGGIILDNKKPIPDEEDGSSLKS